MRKTIILVLLSIIGIGVVNAQVQLKGKKLQKRIELINTEISNGNFEKAIVLFNNPDTIISEKNVSKKEKGIFFTTDSILKSKIVLFDENKSKVLDFKNHYESKDYEIALQLLNLQLNSQNSYRETQDVQSKLKDDLTIINNQYLSFNAINLFVDQLNFIQLEPSQFDLFLNNLKTLINTSDNALNIIVDKYPTLKDVSEKVKENNGNKCITKINQFVTTQINNDLDYEKASKLITKIKTLHSYSDKLYGVFGNNTVFTKQSETFKQVLNDRVTALKKFKEANRPTVIEAIQIPEHPDAIPDTTTVFNENGEKIDPEPVITIKLDTTLLRKGLAGDIDVFYYKFKNPNGLFVDNKELSCILEDNELIPFNGKVNVYDQERGKLLSVHNFINGKKEGKCLSYNFEGRLYSEVNYINGKREGKWVSYDSNGKLESEVNYINGKREGQEYIYYKEKKYPSDYYVNDKREGKCIYYLDGRVYSICSYANDKREGKYSHYLDGKVAEECSYKNDKKEGKEISYWIGDHSIKGEINWVNGLKEGYSFDKKGDVHETWCYYLHGKMRQWMFHDDDGTKHICTMVNGKGDRKVYYSNGNIWFKELLIEDGGEIKGVGTITVYDKYKNGKVDYYSNHEY